MYINVIISLDFFAKIQGDIKRRIFSGIVAAYILHRHITHITKLNSPDDVCRLVATRKRNMYMYWVDHGQQPLVYILHNYILLWRHYDHFPRTPPSLYRKPKKKVASYSVSCPSINLCAYIPHVHLSIGIPWDPFFSISFGLDIVRKFTPRRFIDITPWHSLVLSHTRIHTRDHIDSQHNLCTSCKCTTA